MSRRTERLRQHTDFHKHFQGTMCKIHVLFSFPLTQQAQWLDFKVLAPDVVSVPGSWQVTIQVWDIFWEKQATTLWSRHHVPSPCLTWATLQNIKMMGTMKYHRACGLKFSHSSTILIHLVSLQPQISCMHIPVSMCLTTMILIKNKHKLITRGACINICIIYVF